jgi:hypothetical protein
MKSILSIILKHDYCLPDWISIDEELLWNTNPKLAKFIIKSAPEIKLSMLHMHYTTSTKVEMSLKERKRVIDSMFNDLIQRNPNPGLVKYIMTLDLNHNIIKNDNPAYTDIIRNCYHKRPEYLINNTNPLLADLIIETGNVYHGNPNPGLTDYLLNFKGEYSDAILCNSNPKLTQLIKDKFHTFPEHFADMQLGKNENPELADFIQEFGVVAFTNANPALTEMMKPVDYTNENPKLRHIIKQMECDYGGNPIIVDTSKFNETLDSIVRML